MAAEQKHTQADLAWAVYGIHKAMGRSDDEIASAYPLLWPSIQAKLESMAHKEKQKWEAHVAETASLMEALDGEAEQPPQLVDDTDDDNEELKSTGVRQ